MDNEKNKLMNSMYILENFERSLQLHFLLEYPI